MRKIKVELREPCSKTKEHYLTTNENETYYWCLLCAKELNKDGTEKEN